MKVSVIKCQSQTFRCEIELWICRNHKSWHAAIMMTLIRTVFIMLWMH